MALLILLVKVRSQSATNFARFCSITLLTGSFAFLYFKRISFICEFIHTIILLLYCTLKEIFYL